MCKCQEMHITYECIQIDIIVIYKFQLVYLKTLSQSLNINLNADSTLSIRCIRYSITTRTLLVR